MALDTVLNAGIVRIRHIKKGTGDGQKTILGQTFVPSWSGLNGKRGFQSGHFELRLDDEGTFSLIFPNSAGDDGILHRDRFLIITSGKRVPLEGGGAYSYTGGTYRPGDEWFEIWWGDPGEVVFVGTPTQARVSRDRIELSGYDAEWLLKKVRETTAGFWNHAPRDVLEHYLGVWQAHVASDFDSETFSWSTGVQTDPNNKWSFVRTESSNNNSAPPSTVRLSPKTTSETAFIRSYSGFPVGISSSDKHSCWRVETKFFRSSIGTGGYVRVGLLDNSSSPWAYIQIQNDLTLIKTYGYTSKDVGLDTNPPGPFHIVVEGRGRWIHFYSNGKFLGVMPMPSGSTTGYPYISLKSGTTTSHEYADVDFFICRRTKPFLLSGANKGDYHLPGLPPPGPLVGEYYSDTDLKPYGTGWGSSDYYDSILSPVKTPYSTRGDSALNFGMGIAEIVPSWHPSGPGGEFFSARWTGAVYLDLENYDYRFRALVSDGVRLYIAKTRIGEELLNSWTSQTPNYTSPSQWLKANLSYPSTSGWYPIVVEYMQGQGAGILIVQAQRSDWPTNAWVPIGLSLLDQKILADSPAGYWRLGEGGGSAITTAYDCSQNAANGTYFGSPNTAYSVATLVPGDLCTDFDGTDDSVSIGNVHGYIASPFSIEAWVAVDNVSTNRPIVSKLQNVSSSTTNGWDFYIGTDSKVYLRRFVNGQEVKASSSESIVPGLWTHVIGRYEHQQIFYDSFDNDVIDQIWTDAGQDANVVVSEISGNFKFSYDGNGTGYSSYRTTSISINFSNTRTTFEIVNRGHSEIGWQIICSVHGNNTSNNYVSMRISGSQIQAVKTVSGEETVQATATWNSTSMRFLSIRETSGTTYWEYSEDGSAWNLLHSETNPILMTGGYVLLSAGAYQVASSTSALIGLVKVEKPLLSVWVNGISGTDVSDSRPMTAHSGPLLIGDYPNSFSTELFDGRISRVAVYNYAISQSSIQTHYDSRWQYQDLQFSPYGIFRSHVRFESHFDVVKAIRETFGYQCTCGIRQFESDEFPLQSIPKVRVGRDTEKILDAEEVVEIGIDINAEDVCDALFVDAQGLGDEEISQLTGEGIRFDEIDKHLFVTQEYDSLADISFPPLIDQRINSLLALRGSVWEEVSARPPGHRELLDAFPLPDVPEYENFKWWTGDGIRLNIQEIGVVDSSPRQILAIRRTFTPEGMGRPVASFRQRPRNLKEMLRKISRGTLIAKRNYQGQIVSLSGTVGGKNDTYVTDPFSRASIPFNVEEIVKGILFILNKSNTSSWTVEINGTNRFSIVSPGMYDITAWSKPDSSNPQINVQLTGGSGSVVYKTEFIVRVAHG